MEEQSRSKEASAPKERDYALDNLKGVLIILVIVGHADLLPAFKSNMGDFLQGYIYLFHMPLFFGVSSLFVKEFSGAYLLKRFMQLMIPFYFFVVIDPIHLVTYLINPGLALTPLIYDFSVKELLKRAFVGSSFYLQSAFWFLPALFLSNILLGLFIKYKKNKGIIAVFAVAFMSVLFLAIPIQKNHYRIIYGLDVAIYIIPLLLVLRYLYQNKERFSKFPALFYIAGAVIISTLIIYIIPKRPATSLSGRFDLAQFYVPNTPWGYLLICSLSVFLFLFLLKFNKRSLFSFIGFYSLPIFILHNTPWLNEFQSLPPGWYLLINVVGNVILCILISKTLMKISPAFKWIGMVA